MKSFNKILYILAVLLLGTLVSCVQEDVYEEGTPDLTDCYGVYFPTQSALSKTWDFAPVVPAEDEGEGEEGADTASKADEGEGEETPEAPSPHKMTFTVKRLNDKGTINVPYTISPADVFIGTEIKFEDGQTETTFDVYFSNDASVGVTYECHVVVDNPEYALTYSNDYKASMIAEAVLIKWNRVYGPNGEEYGYWRDGFVTTLFGLPTKYNEEVIFEERDDKPGYYRLSNLYNAKYTYSIMAPVSSADEKYYEDNLCDPDAYVFIDATNPEKVIMPGRQTLGLIVFQYGSLQILQYTDDHFIIEPIQSEYGVFKAETGTFEFPAESFYVLMGGNPYAWSSGDFDVKLPGFPPIDYSVELEPYHTSNGVVDIDYAFGSSVSMIKYGVYEGSLTAGQAKDKADELSKKADASVAYGPEGTLKVNGGETGLYTLVTANYCTNRVDDREPDEYVDYSYTVFTYLKNPGDMPVALTTEFNATDRYASAGFTAENSFELYLAGKDIESVYVHVEEGDYSAYPDETLVAYLQSMIEDEDDPLEPLDDEVLAEVNAEGGWYGVSGGMLPGTTYTLMVYADNGYTKDLIVRTATTAGKYNITAHYFTSEDFYPISDPAILTGKYDYYAVDLLSGNPERQYIGEVTATYYQGYVLFSGLTGDGAEKAGLEDDTVVWSYGANSQIVYTEISTFTDSEQNPICYVDGKIELPLAIGYINDKGGVKCINSQSNLSQYGYESLLIASLVVGNDGTMAIAFDDYGMGGSNKYTGFGLSGFGSYYEPALKVFSAYNYPILVPKAASEPDTVPASAPAKMKGKNHFKPADIKVEREIKEAENLDIKVVVRENAQTGSPKGLMDLEVMSEGTAQFKEYQVK